MSVILELQDIRKSFGEGQLSTEVLHGISFRLQAGEFTALIGPSGSGKSTLLNLIGLLERQSSGEILINGYSTRGLNDDQLSALRGKSIGFIFQFHHLLNAFSACENVFMPGLIQTRQTDESSRMRAEELLCEVGLRGKTHLLPNQLSGGQQQRVAIARALSANPPLILADEPTGNLDTQTADEVFTLLRKFNREMGTTFLIVTHDPRLAERCDRVLHLVDGRIVEDRSRAVTA